MDGSGEDRERRNGRRIDRYRNEVKKGKAEERDAGWKNGMELMEHRNGKLKKNGCVKGKKGKTKEGKGRRKRWIKR